MAALGDGIGGVEISRQSAYNFFFVITFAEWAWILIVLVCALGCGAIGYGVAWGLARTNGGRSRSSRAQVPVENSSNEEV